MGNVAATDRSVTAITAAMPGGTGIDKFGRRFPKRTFDVGIAEQHAVTFAAGLAVEGLKPFCSIYSTFMQRAYDQIIHDVAIQKLPVRFVLDRAGLVGNDGPTYHGTFDLAYLGCIPNMLICAPSDEIELKHMVQTIYEIDDKPTALRYPRGSALGFGDHVLHFLALGGYLDNGNLKVRPMVIPDKYIETGSMDQQYEEAGLSESFIAATALKLLGKESLSASMKFAPPPESGEAQIA